MITGGYLPFYCSECGKTFFGIAMEWYATSFTAPLKCPKCGSWHTRPWSFLPSKLANHKYKDIWKAIDKHQPT